MKPTALFEKKRCRMEVKPHVIYNPAEELERIDLQDKLET